MLLQVAAAAKQLAPASGKLQLNPLLACVGRTASEHGRVCSNWADTNSSDEQQETSSWRETLIMMSSYTTCLQGHLQQLASNPLALFTARPAAAATGTSFTAATAAAAGTPWTRFNSGPISQDMYNSQRSQIRRYRTSSSGQYWLRQFGLADASITHLLMGANIAVFGLQLLWPEVTQMFARVDALVYQGQIWRLLTAAFLHGNIVHLGINTLALYNIGHVIEGVLGSRTFLMVYLGSAILGNLLAYNSGHGFQTSLGSSGALCGIFGGYLVFRWMNRRVWPMRGPEFTSVATTLGINLALMTYFAGSLDSSAHLGGFLGGAALTYILTAARRF